MGSVWRPHAGMPPEKEERRSNVISLIPSFFLTSPGTDWNAAGRTDGLTSISPKKFFEKNKERKLEPPPDLISPTVAFHAAVKERKKIFFWSSSSQAASWKKKLFITLDPKDSSFIFFKKKFPSFVRQLTCVLLLCLSSFPHPFYFHRSRFPSLQNLRLKNRIPFLFPYKKIREKHGGYAFSDTTIMKLYNGPSLPFLDFLPIN